MSEREHLTRMADTDRGWRVVRLDDNGNAYVVAEFATETEAREVAARYEARAHKQTYFVARTASRK